MIINFNDLSKEIPRKTNICIVGAGAIGLTIAAEFLNHKSQNIIIIESGNLTNNEQIDEFNQVTNTGDIESGTRGSRHRGFGGSTELWGGQALLFSPIDFRVRDWIKHSGWPIEFGSLEKYYQRASNILQLRNSCFENDIWLNSKVNFKQSFLNSPIKAEFSKWSPQPKFSQVFRHKIESSKNITTIVNATVTELIPDQSHNKIECLEIKNLSERAEHIYADIFILCCGGIENPRILLNSNSVIKSGIGNDYGNVGKYYQDHIGFYGAKILPLNLNKFRRLFSTKLSANQKYLPKLSLTSDFQTEKKTLNVTGNIEIASNKNISLDSFRSLYLQLRKQPVSLKTLSNLLDICLKPKLSFMVIYTYLFHKEIFIPDKSDYFLIANCEAAPIADSQISLSDETDSLGLKKANINWLVNDQSKKTMLEYFNNVKIQLEKHGIATLEVKPNLLNDDNEWKKDCYGLYHHMGSTRMSKTAANGVVDDNCRVHSVENLYIAGSSVFPTSSASNPTFTAMALAIRLADHLKQNS